MALGVSIPSCSPPTPCVYMHMCACARVCTPGCAHLTGPGASCLLGTPNMSSLVPWAAPRDPRVWLGSCHA